MDAGGFAWVAGQTAGAAFQVLVTGVLASRGNRKRLLDEICGPQAPRAVRETVMLWLEAPSTPHLLAQLDTASASQAALTLQDCLRDVGEHPAAELLVRAARGALLRRAPATPEVEKLRRRVEEAAKKQSDQLDAIGYDIRRVLDMVDIVARNVGEAMPEVIFPQFVGVPDRKPFIGRGEELEELEVRLESDGAPNTVILQATVGLGGVGKTALAVEVCHRQRAARDLVRWLTADDPNTLRAQFLRIAAALGVDVRGLDELDAVARIRHWFETTTHRWLLVFDNVEDPRVLDGLVPQSTAGVGAVLITSRHRDWTARHVVPMRLSVLERDDAVALLCTVSQRAVDEDAVALAEDLGGLALALEQAGAFVRQTGWSFARYLDMLHERAEELLARGVVPPGHSSDVAVLTTWDASVERATAEAAGAPAVLGVLAYLAADFLPRQLFGAPAEDEDLLNHGDVLFIDEAIAALDRYSLIVTHADPGSCETSTLSVHRLTQEVTRLRHRRQRASDEWHSLAVRLVERVIPAGPSVLESWMDLDVLVSSILALRAHTPHESKHAILQLHERFTAYGERQTVVPYLRQKTARATLYRLAGRTDEMIATLEEVVAEAERKLGSEDPVTVTLRKDLASAYRDGRRTDEAATMEECVEQEGGDDLRD